DDGGWRCVIFTIRYTAPSRLRLLVTIRRPGLPARGASGPQCGRPAPRVGEGDDGGRAERPPGAARGTRPDMQSTPLLRHILRDEAVTRGLGDVEARMIVEWMADRDEQIAASDPTEEAAQAPVRPVSRRSRVIAWCLRLGPNTR